MICRARNRLIYGARSWLICRTGSWLVCRAGSRLICRARSRWVCSVRHRGAFTLQPPFSPRTLAPARSRPPAPRPRGSHGAGASSPGGSTGGRAGPGAGGHRTRRGETGQEEGKQCGEEKQVYIFSRASGSSPPCSWGGAGREGKRRHRREVLSPGAEHGPRPPSPACREQLAACVRAGAWQPRGGVAGCDPSAAVLRGTERSRREAGNREGKRKDGGASLSRAGPPGGSRG